MYNFERFMRLLLGLDFDREVGNVMRVTGETLM